LFEVGDRLLEDVPEDLDIDQAAGGLLFVGDLARRAVVVVAESFEERTRLVGDVQATIEDGVESEEPAVVGRDAQGRVALVDGPEESPEVIPYRVRIVGVRVREGFLERLLRKQAPVLAEGRKEHTVEQLLRVEKKRLRLRAGVGLAQGRVKPPPDVRIVGVEGSGKFDVGLFGGFQEVVEMTPSLLGYDAPSPQEKYETP